MILIKLGHDGHKQALFKLSVKLSDLSFSVRKWLTHLHAHKGSHHWKWGPALQRSWICWATAWRRRTAEGWAPSCSTTPTPSYVLLLRPRCSFCDKNTLIRRERGVKAALIKNKKEEKVQLWCLTYKTEHKLLHSGRTTRAPRSHFGHQIHTTDYSHCSCSMLCSGHLKRDSVHKS